MSDGPGYQWWSSASSDAQVAGYRANGLGLGRGRLYTGEQLRRCVMAAADRLVTIRAGDLDELYTRAYGTTEMRDVTGDEHEMLARVMRAWEAAATPEPEPANPGDGSRLAGDVRGYEGSTHAEMLQAATRTLGYQLAAESRRASEWPTVHEHYERLARDLIDREYGRRERVVEVATDG